MFPSFSIFPTISHYSNILFLIYLSNHDLTNRDLTNIITIMMNNKHTFIGREKELSFLEKQYNRTGGSLVFIYGRRRVGKTETIKQFAKDRDALFYTCTQTDDKSQLNTFSKVLLSKNSTASKYINSFESWESAFLSIKDLTNNEKKKLILVIDEFPYMVKENKSIPSILQKLWDTTFQELNIMIILCGSSMSYI